jgi:hypothetical protein
MSGSGYLHERRERSAFDATKFRRSRRIILTVPGYYADALGSLVLRAYAAEQRLPLLVEGPSQYHEGKIFLP